MSSSAVVGPASAEQQTTKGFIEGKGKTKKKPKTSLDRSFHIRVLMSMPTSVCGRLVALGTFALRSPCYQGPPLIDTLSGRVANQ